MKYIIHYRPASGKPEKMHLFEADGWDDAIQIFSDWLDDELPNDLEFEYHNITSARTKEISFWMNRFGTCPDYAFSRPLWFYGDGIYTTGDNPELIKLTGYAPNSGIIGNYTLIEIES